MSLHVRHARLLLLGAGLLGCAGFAGQAAGQGVGSYPTRPVRVLVGVASGGGLDAITRMVTQKLGERLGQTFIVDNRPGATSTIAMGIAASATPDGYTLMSATKTMILNGALEKVPYDITKVYVPIAAMSNQTYVMVVNPSLPVKSMSDLLRHAKASPKGLNYGSAGLGSLQHVGMELLKSMSGLQILHVPYKGGGPAIIDLLAGQIHVMPSVTTTVGPHLRSGKLRAIAVTGAKRIGTLPSIPTVAESGVPGFELVNLYGLYAPARTSPGIVRAINKEVGQIMVLPDLRKILAADGVESPDPQSPEEFRDVVVQEYRRWAEFAKKSGIKF